MVFEDITCLPKLTSNSWTVPEREAENIATDLESQKKHNEERFNVEESLDSNAEIENFGSHTPQTFTTLRAEEEHVAENSKLVQYMHLNKFIKPLQRITEEKKSRAEYVYMKDLNTPIE